MQSANWFGRGEPSSRPSVASPFRNRRNPLFAAVGRRRRFRPRLLSVDWKRRGLEEAFNVPFHFERAQRNESIRAKSTDDGENPIEFPTGKKEASMGKDGPMRGGSLVWDLWVENQTHVH